MNFEESRQRLMSHPLDPRPSFMDVLEQIAAITFGGSGTPDDIRDEILSRELTEITPDAEHAYEHGSFDGRCREGLLARFRAGLERAISFERRPGGRLYTWLPSDEVQRVAATGYFSKYVVNGFEVAALGSGLEQGERIDVTVPAFRSIKTDRREILRGGDFFDHNRPSNTSKGFWLGQCTSAARLAEAEAMANRKAEVAARPFSASSGPNAGESTVMQR